MAFRLLFGLQRSPLRLRAYFRGSGIDAHALAIMFARPYRVRLSTAAMSALVFGLLVAPMAAFVLLHHSDQINWVSRPALGEVIHFLRLLTAAVVSC